MATGFELKLPMDQGEGQKWNISPENLYSNPQKVNIQKNNFVEIKLNNEIPMHSNILEAGCGTGQLSIFLSKYKRQIFSIDLSSNIFWILGADVCSLFILMQATLSF